MTTGWFARTPNGPLSYSLDGLYSLTFKTCSFAPSGWVLEMPADHQAVPILKQNGAGIVKMGEGARNPATGLWDYGLSSLSGHVLPGPSGMSTHSQTYIRSGGTVTFFGQSDLSFFWDRLIIPETPTGPAWTVTDQISTVIADVFRVQFADGGAGFIDLTRGSNSVFEGYDSTLGNTVTLTGRYENAGELLAPLVDIGGGWVSALYVAATEKVSFQHEAFRTSNVPTISVDGGTADSVTIDVQPIRASRVYLVDGSLEAIEVNDADSDPWTLREVATTDGRVKVALGTSAMQAIAERSLDLGALGVSFEISDGVEVGLGDEISVIVPDVGLLTGLRVTSRTITLEPDNQTDRYTVGETVTSQSGPISRSGIGGSGSPTLQSTQLFEVVTISNAKWGTRSGYMPLTVARSGGIVTLCGVLEQTTVQTAFETIGTLDAAYRPSARVSGVSVDAVGAIRRIDVLAAGRITMSGTATSLHEGISLSWPV